MSQQIQIVIALQEAFAKMGWDVSVGVSRSVASVQSSYCEGVTITVDLMQLSEHVAKALDR